MMEVHTWEVWDPCEWEPLVSCRGDTRPPENTAGTSSWHEMQCSEEGALHRAALSTQSSHKHKYTYTLKHSLTQWNSLMCLDTEKKFSSCYYYRPKNLPLYNEPPSAYSITRHTCSKRSATLFQVSFHKNKTYIKIVWLYQTLQHQVSWSYDQNLLNHNML